MTDSATPTSQGSFNIDAVARTPLINVRSVPQSPTVSWSIHIIGIVKPMGYNLAFRSRSKAERSARTLGPLSIRALEICLGCASPYLIDLVTQKI